MRLFSISMILGLALALTGCPGESKPATTPTAGTGGGTTTGTDAGASSAQTSDVKADWSKKENLFLAYAAEQVVPQTDKDAMDAMKKVGLYNSKGFLVGTEFQSYLKARTAFETDHADEWKKFTTENSKDWKAYLTKNK